MSKSPFKTIPTLEQIATRVFQLHNELRELNQMAGERMAQFDQTIQENNQLTDAAIEELNLKIAFVMTMVQVKRPLNSGLAGADGKVQYEQVPLLEMYLKGGREMLIEKRAAAQRALDAKSLPTETPNGCGSGLNKDAPDEQHGPPDTDKLLEAADAARPKLVTH